MKHLEKNNELIRLKDGWFQLEKDQEALELFMEEVVEKTIKFGSLIQHIDYLIENKYYPNIFEKYLPTQVESIYNELVGHEFKFQSYTSATKFYNSYALKTFDKKYYLEDYNLRVLSVALYLAQGDFNKAREFAISMITGCYQPATPTFSNSGKYRAGELVSCFILSMDDTLNSIFHTNTVAAQLSRLGGGVGIDLSYLRGRGAKIRDVEGVAKGVVPVMKELETTFTYADQLGTRKGSGVGYLNIFHYDVEELIASRGINVAEEARLKSISIGLVIPSLFFTLAAKKRDLVLIEPKSFFDEYGYHFADMEFNIEFYDEVIANPNVMTKKATVNPREMLVRIAVSHLESGYPYLMFKDNVNKVHPLSGIGDVKISNLC